MSYKIEKKGKKFKLAKKKKQAITSDDLAVMAMKKRVASMKDDPGDHEYR